MHFVVPEMDAGPIIAQGAVPVLAGDTEASLAARVLEVEHRIYPQALRLVAEGRVRIEDGRCLIDGKRAGRRDLAIHRRDHAPRRPTKQNPRLSRGLRETTP